MNLMGGHDEDDTLNADSQANMVASVLDQSPSVSRIFVFSSNDFAADKPLQISSVVQGSQYNKPVQLVENTLDWSTQNRDLMTIRSRESFARKLKPISDEGKYYWEIFNYGFALLLLALVFILYAFLRRSVFERFRSMKLI